MDPLHFAILWLRSKGHQVERNADRWLELYTMPGYPELTRGQMYQVARNLGYVGQEVPR